MPVLLVGASLSAFAPGGGQAQRRAGTAGVTVLLPRGWHAWEPPHDIPAVTDPRTRVVAVSAPFGFADTGCQVAAYAFPKTAVAVVVVEWTRLWRQARWKPRPDTFTSGSLRVRPPPAIECFDGSGGSAQFVEHGRHFGAYLLAGTEAAKSVVAQALAVLDSLRVAPG